MMSKSLLGVIASGIGMVMAFGLTVGCATQDPSPQRDESTTSVGEADQDIGGPGGSDCTGHTVCYCQCRLNHQCGSDPAQCAPQAACLTRCDQTYPTCVGDDPGPRNPTSPRDCIL